jgi:hypothetical protein
MKNEQVNQTGPTSQNPNTLALMHADLKKLIRYFKLDRHSKSNSDDTEGVVDAADEERDKLLREMREDVGWIKQATDRKDFTVEQKISLETIKSTVGKALRDFNDIKYAEIKTSIDGVKQSVDDLKTVKQDSTIHHEHRHIIDMVSSKNFFVLATMGFVIFVSVMLHIYQLDRIRVSRNNDLKYRYVKMRDGATPGEIKLLETVFTYDRNPDSIKLIRRQVIQYERLVKEQAKKIEQAWLNASEAERLRQEVETVKGEK